MQSDAIYPFVPLNRGKSGGKIDFDHRGGANGGFEVVYFPGAIPADGGFLVTGTNLSGETTNVSLDVIAGGRVLDPQSYLDPALHNSGNNLGPTQEVVPRNSALFLILGDPVRAAVPTTAKKRR